MTEFHATLNIAADSAAIEEPQFVRESILELIANNLIFRADSGRLREQVRPFRWFGPTEHGLLLDGTTPGQEAIFYPDPMDQHGIPLDNAALRVEALFWHMSADPSPVMPNGYYQGLCSCR